MTPSAPPVGGPGDPQPTTTHSPLSLAGNWAADLESELIWKQVVAGDEWAVLELATQQGPSGLLHRLERGGPGAAAAALAWPHVPTAWAFRGAWCSHSLRYQASDWAVLLRALGDSARHRDVVGEELEPEILSECDRLLSQAERQLATVEGAGPSELRDTYTAARSAVNATKLDGKP